LNLKKFTNVLGSKLEIDYNSLVRGIESDDEHSAIVTSHSSNSFREIEAFTYMADIAEEIVKKFEEQARVQHTHHEILQAQQESINDLKKTIGFLFKKSKKKTKSLKTKPSSLKSKGKEEDENSTFDHSDGNENNFRYENPESSSSEEPEDSEVKHAKKMKRNAWRISQIKTIFKKRG